MPSFPSFRPVLRVGLAALTIALAQPAGAAVEAAPAAVATGFELSPWTLGSVLLLLCGLSLWRWFRRLPDEVGRAGGWRQTLRGVVLRNAVAAIVAWQLGAGVFRDVLARYAHGSDGAPLRVAMPIALAAATVGFLVARWLMVFAQRAWRRRRRIGS